jgi:archaellum component FlaG (FlaF/FlaG flagellin family)
MQFIKAHVFNTLEEANNAIEVINQGEGIPINETATTRTYTEAKENNGNIYIAADSVTEKYLGEPTDLELIFNEEI